MEAEVPGKKTVLALLDDGLDYSEIGRRLGISAGLVHLLGTGKPADGGDTVTAAERTRTPFAGGGSQQLGQPTAHNPTEKPEITAWVRKRASADEQMRKAGADREGTR
jgi:hypothetical protein